ncbi:MAG: 2Fe-2S iron-sulfur cluster-binding protein [Polaromonas sp.]|nr:2Fe-2S iron-sulfur cluster-binding protein [Polaromonas sp.]MDP2451398.1 2Fe-2S iron-sulfur cluster-binding protein [Polaromonas sp.]MDP3828749.1 2Fe-2S iron-sulfur cluster-binding protein [Polaromonas sp.]
MKVIRALCMLAGIPNMFGKKEPLEITVSSHGLQFAVPSGKTLLEAALESGIGFPHDCKVGTCGSCRYRLDEGRISELDSSARALSGADYQAGFRLGCQTLPRSNLSIWLLSLSEPVAVAQAFDGRIARVAPLTGDIVELKLRLDRPISFVPGQYAELSVEAIQGARSYSFADAKNCESTDEVSFHIRRVPGEVFTGWLFAGDRLGAPLRCRGRKADSGYAMATPRSSASGAAADWRHSNAFSNMRVALGVRGPSPCSTVPAPRPISTACRKSMKFQVNGALHFVFCRSFRPSRTIATGAAHAGW